jgi:iron(III) transport system permease protein
VFSSGRSPVSGGRLLSLGVGARLTRLAGQLSLPPSPLLLIAILIAGVMLLPLIYLIVRVIGSPETALTMMGQPRVLGLLVRTTGFAIAVTLGGILLGVPLAWLTVRSDLPYRRLWSIALALPLVIPTYVGGYIFVAALGPRGLLQQLLAVPFGVQRLPELYGFGGATAVLIAFTYPYVFLSVRSALARIDPSLEEASRSLGSSGPATFFRVVLPQLRPSLTAGGLLVALYALSDFGAVALLQFDTFTRAIYVQYQGSFDRSGAAALALLLAVLTVGVLAVEVRTRGRARYHRSTAGAVRSPRQIPLGRWRWPAILFCGSVMTLSLVLPVSVLLYWLTRGLSSGVSSGIIWASIVGSVQAAALTAIVASALALPLAILAVRYPGALTTVVERITYAGFALPGIVTALALVFFGANFVPFLYQTLSLLVVAYVVRFLPQALGSVRSSLLQVGPHVEEAARSLGRSPLQVWRDVTIPLIWPGILSGAALVFLTTMKELPATLLLSPTGYRTLAVTTWSAAAEGFFAEAAVPALLLVLCSIPPLYMLLGRGSDSRTR